MLKRFTDVDKWEDSWYRKLPLKTKVFWAFICDRCDRAGYWKIDMDLAAFMIGEPAELDAEMKLLNDGKERVKMAGDCIQILHFVEFQYGNLSPDCRPHRPILALAARHASKQQDFHPLPGQAGGKQKGVDTLPIPYRKGTSTLEDKDKDKDKGGVGETREHPDHLEAVRLDVFEKLWAEYPVKDGKKDALRHFRGSVKNAADLADIQRALTNYLGSEKVKKGFIKNGSTWFNNWRDWIELNSGFAVEIRPFRPYGQPEDAI